jgi:hypothetical protein
MSTELAWAAGFFDGEGTVGTTVGSSDTLYVRLQITQSGSDDVVPEVLTRFQAAVNLGTIYGPYYYGDNTYARYVLTIAGYVGVRKVIDLLTPYLGSVKRNQAEKALSECSREGKLRSKCRHGHEFTEENTYIDAIGNRHCRTCRNDWMRNSRMK